jgi:hypothetical protein
MSKLVIKIFFAISLMIIGSVMISCASSANSVKSQPKEIEKKVEIENDTENNCL